MKKLFLLMLVTVVSFGMVYSASITVTYPTAGTEIAKGSTVVITWNAVGTTNPFKLTLWKGGVTIDTITTNFAAGNGNRTYSWVAPNTCGTGYKIKVKEKSAAVAGYSGEFKITGCPTLIPDHWKRWKEKLRRIRWPWPPEPPWEIDWRNIREIIKDLKIREEVTFEIVKGREVFGKAVIGRGMRGKSIPQLRVAKLRKFSKVKQEAMKAGKGFKLLVKNAKGKVVFEQEIRVEKRARR